MKKTGLIAGLIILVTAVSIALNFYIKKQEEDVANNSTRFVELEFESLQTKIDNKESFILVIEKTGCIYCEEFEPIVKGVLEEYKIYAYKINTANLSDENRIKFNSILSVSGTPTTVFFKNGEEETTMNRLVGKVSRNDFVKRLKSLGYIES